MLNIKIRKGKIWYSPVEPDTGVAAWWCGAVAVVLWMQQHTNSLYPPRCSRIQHWHTSVCRNATNGQTVYFRYIIAGILATMSRVSRTAAGLLELHFKVISPWQDSDWWLLFARTFVGCESKPDSCSSGCFCWSNPDPFSCIHAYLDELQTLFGVQR